jgi:glycosyltransferase involved in cell wall biosynthesis
MGHTSQNPDSPATPYHPNTPSQTPEDLAVVILTKNEAENISACITSIKPHVSEIHVVDSGSTDDTRDLASKRGAKVTLHEMHPFLISDQRNWALDNLSIECPWVLFLDADERLTEAAACSIRDAIHTGGHDAYFLAPRFQYQGTWLRHYMGFPNWHPRLVRPGRARFAGGVWETFATDVSAAYICEPYLHLVNSKGIDDWIERHLRYADWEAQSAVDDRYSPRKAGARRLVFRTGPLRILAVLAYHLLWRRGFLDGPAAWAYARRTLIYQLLISEAIREKRLGDAATQ